MEEGARLRVFKNRVLRKIFGRKREKVTFEWRRLHHEELHDLTKYYMDDQIKMNGLHGPCGTYEGEERCMQSFDGKCDGNRPLERLRLSCEDNIKVDLQVTGWVGGSVDRIDLFQDRGRWLAIVNKVMKLGSIKWQGFLD